MSTFEDPNREAVGLDPIWTGADASGQAPPGEVIPEFDPGDHTVAEVEQYVADHPDQREAVLDAELAGKNRTTLVGSLES
jgi:hypothetical protein